MTSCCGQMATSPLSERHRMTIRYLGGRPLRVVGPATKQMYEFSGKVREQFVDPRDAVSMVRHGVFRFVGLVELESEENHHG